jgi:hypothetical protein
MVVTLSFNGYVGPSMGAMIQAFVIFGWKGGNNLNINVPCKIQMVNYTVIDNFRKSNNLTERYLFFCNLHLQS